MRDVKVQEAPFADANVWVYALVTDAMTARKTEIAKNLVTQNNFIISTQVVNEVCSNLLRKAKFKEERIPGIVSSFYKKCTVVEVTMAMLLRASDLRRSYSFSFWDSLIVSAALVSNSAILYSEDMQDGLVVDGKLRIVNPFK